MCYLMFSYKWRSRDLRKIIVAIVKSWFVDNVKKVNYVHNYSLVDGKVEKSDENLVLIHTQNHDNLLNFLAEKFPELERITIE